MFLHLSARSTLFKSSLVLLLCFHTASAQSGAFSFTNIFTNTTIDLYNLYKDIFPDGALISWEISDKEGSVHQNSFEDPTDFTNIELMAGPSEEASNVVVDIIVVNFANPTEQKFSYFYPASLPLGLYHLRLNGTVNATEPIQRFTARSATVNVTTSSPIGCGPKKPAPFSNVSSPSDPRFSSVRINRPSAGFNHGHIPDSKLNNDEVLIIWDFRDYRNDNANPYSSYPFDNPYDMTIQILDDATSEPVGPLTNSDSLALTSIRFADVPMKINGSYRVELKYHNKYPDGAVRPGEVVTVTSDAFNVVSIKDELDNCGAISSSQSSNPTPSDAKGFSKLVTFYQIAWVGCLVTVIHLL